MATTSRVVEALDTLYASTDNKLKRDADRWLGSFQKTVKINHNNVCHSFFFNFNELTYSLKLGQSLTIF